MKKFFGLILFVVLLTGCLSRTVEIDFHRPVTADFRWEVSSSDGDLSQVNCLSYEITKNGVFCLRSNSTDPAAQAIYLHAANGTLTAVDGKGVTYSCNVNPGGSESFTCNTMAAFDEDILVTVQSMTMDEAHRAGVFQTAHIDWVFEEMTTLNWECTLAYGADQILCSTPDGDQAVYAYVDNTIVMQTWDLEPIGECQKSDISYVCKGNMPNVMIRTMGK